MDRHYRSAHHGHQQRNGPVRHGASGFRHDFRHRLHHAALDHLDRCGGLRGKAYLKEAGRYHNRHHRPCGTHECQHSGQFQVGPDHHRCGYHLGCFKHPSEGQTQGLRHDPVHRLADGFCGNCSGHLRHRRPSGRRGLAAHGLGNAAV